jgi:hypothetical protein
VIRALLFRLGDEHNPAAVATFDGGHALVECDDPDLKLRLTTVLNLPASAAKTLEEIGEELEPGTEQHFRAALSASTHLGLRAVFEED